MADITTIKITKETKSRLDHLREYERESYDEILKKILYILNLNRKNPMFSFKVLRNIDSSIRRKERYHTLDFSEPEEEQENKPKQETKTRKNK